MFQQATGLISELDQDTQNWLKQIYSPHYRGGPDYSGFDPGEEKGIGLRAGIGGMQVPASKIMNASQLRACVWAFVFSLRERVQSRIGGLDCMLLDDPQNHFDPINSEKLGAAIPKTSAHRMRPIITSNDYRFLTGIMDKLPNLPTGSPSRRALAINPISSSRLTAGVSPHVAENYSPAGSLPVRIAAPRPAIRTRRRPSASGLAAMGRACPESPGAAQPTVFPGKAEQRAARRAAFERKGGDGARSGIALPGDGGAMPAGEACSGGA